MPKRWANATCFVDPVAVGQIVLPPSTVVATSQSFLRVHSFGSSSQAAAIVTDALISRAITVRHCLKGYTYQSLGNLSKCRAVMEAGYCLDQ